MRREDKQGWKRVGECWSMFGAGLALGSMAIMDGARWITLAGILLSAAGFAGILIFGRIETAPVRAVGGATEARRQRAE